MHCKIKNCLTTFSSGEILEWIGETFSILVSNTFVSGNFRTRSMTTNVWMEKGWGDSFENATFDDIKIAIEETIKMDEEHGAFWVGHIENEFVLEVHKNFDLFFVCGENQDEQIQTKLDNWEDVKHFFKMYFNGQFEKLKKEIELRPFTYKKLTNG